MGAVAIMCGSVGEIRRIRLRFVEKAQRTVRFSRDDVGSVRVKKFVGSGRGLFKTGETATPIAPRL